MLLLHFFVVNLRWFGVTLVPFLRQFQIACPPYALYIGYTKVLLGNSGTIAITASSIGEVDAEIEWKLKEALEVSDVVRKFWKLRIVSEGTDDITGCWMNASFASIPCQFWVDLKSI